VKRDEKGLAIVVVLVASAFAAVIVTGIADTLGGLAWFSNGSNLIQWISGPATLAAVATALWMRWHRTCAVPYCLRFGEHPVNGTLRKVCAHHHSIEHHLLVYDIHGEAHRLGAKLGWGESHSRRSHVLQDHGVGSPPSC
jgi:hypothetical protein